VTPAKSAPAITILVVDDKANMLTLLAKVLREDGRVLKATSGAAAQKLLAEQPVDAVVCDLKMLDMDGLAVLDATRRARPNATFILMTAYATVESAIDAMKRGADDYVTKPFEPDVLRATLLRAIARRRPPEEPVAVTEPAPGLLGASPAMRELARVLGRVANGDGNTLVMGETGTGKRLCARAIHLLGPRANSPFVTVTCRGIASEDLEAELFGSRLGGRPGEERPALFERAPGGTVFLDEVGELRLGLQARLVRVLEERHMRHPTEPSTRAADPRIVASTHRDLDAMAREGSFREDLLYRLRMTSVLVPPLRERSGDVELLAGSFLSGLVNADRAPLRFAPEALVVLERYAWPGNVRELRAAIERAAVAASGPIIEAADLPAEIRSGNAFGAIDLSSMSYQQALEAAREDATRRYVEAVLRRTNGRVVQAAEIAGIERESFYRLLRRYGISPEDFRTDE
jgi:DNA-binding NtrC family response regulator